MQQESNPTGRRVLGAKADEGLPKRFGPYTLLDKIASGGMAEVYLALQHSVAGFEKLVVIKRILPSMTRDEAFVGMLLHEARIAASLAHPNVVQVFDVGFYEGAYCIAMEHCHGEDLRSIVRQMKAQGTSEFPLEQALGIVAGVCAGLGYAHERCSIDGARLGIVHRDVSPHNVLVTFDGEVKIVDFGIAKSGDQESEDTKVGRLKGKVPYMSPEQARGEVVDWRSDIFSAGIMLFELTTGRRLFKGAHDVETLRMICERECPSPSLIRPGYPRPLEAVVMRALAKDRERRYQRASDMQGDLEAFARDERLGISRLESSRWMRALFASKLVQQREALQSAKQRADALPTQSPQASRTSAQDGSASARTVSGGRKRPAALLIAAGVVAGAGLGGAGSYLARQSSEVRVPHAGAPAGQSDSAGVSSCEAASR